jgi:uncharacterized repeat protein (TIGR03803 family)
MTHFVPHVIVPETRGEPMLVLLSLIRQKVPSFTERAALRMAAVSIVLATVAWGQSTEKVLVKSLINGNGGLTSDQNGDLYGTDQKLTRFGAIYRLHRWPNGAWQKTILYHFAGGTDGSSPNPSLVFDQAGNLYGTTAEGGDGDRGTVFQLIPTLSLPWTKKVLYNFEFGPYGFYPSNVIIDDQGNLYGTTFLGPHGTIFELVHSSDGIFTHKVLYQFTGGADGGNPTTGLVRDSAGNLYGTTHSGGVTGHGTVFELSPEADGTWTFHLAYTFCSRTNCADGNPGSGGSSVTLDSHRNLYGVTFHGGHSLCGSPSLSDSGCGVAFKLTHLRSGAWAFQLLHSFCSEQGCVDGQFPGGGVVLDGAGNVYGTTSGGGANRFGTVFKLSHVPGSPWSEKVLYSFCSAFNCADGKGPLGSLLLDGMGNLFGTTLSVVFEVIGDSK